MSNTQRNVDCFPPRYPLGGRAIANPTGGTAQAAPINPPRSYNGNCFTPKGTLKVLVIYAGFTNDNQLGAFGVPAPTPNNNNNSDNPWPQLGGSGTNGEWGNSLPPSAANTFYTNASQFSTTATDLTLSNFYYQMSQHNTLPLKLLAVNFPFRVNVTATAAIDTSGGAWWTYSQMALDRIRTDYQTQLRTALSQGIDTRVNAPNYASDNTFSGPDNQIDYTVIVWRYAGGSPSGTVGLVRASGSSGGYAAVPYVTLTPPGVVPAITTADGFTQCAGFGGLYKSMFTHELGHTLYDAPHVFGANGVIGKHFDGTAGYGMIGGPMLDCANGWERNYLAWIPLAASGVNTNISDAASLPASGLLTLRDFITTGDVVRIRLPNSQAADGTYQYLWLENHQGRSVWDRRQWEMDGRTPSVPFPSTQKGLLAYVEDMHVTQTTPRGPTNNGSLVDLGAGGLRLLAADGNYDTTPTGASSTFNGHLWGWPIFDLTGRASNPLGPNSHLTGQRADLNGDGVISYNPYTNGSFGGPSSSEGYGAFKSIDGQLVDGPIGVGAAFNVVGQKMGMGENPALFPSQEFNQNTQQLSPINLNGLSVTLTNVAANGDITVRVQFDDVNLTRTTSWTGNVALNPVPGASAAAVVLGGVNLVLNSSGVPNRSTTAPFVLGISPFVNPTRLTVRNGATLRIEDLGKITLRTGSTLYVEDNGTLFSQPDGRIQVQRGCRVSVKTQAMADALRASGQLILMPGGQLEIRDPNVVITGRAAVVQPVLEIYPNPTTTLAFRLLEAKDNATYRYRVLNAYGQVVHTATVPTDALATGVQFTGLPAGPYLVEVQNVDGSTRTAQQVEVR